MKTFFLTLFISISNLFAQDPAYSLLDISDGFSEALALDINNQGQVVGYGITNSELGSPIAFRWENGTNTLIAPGAAVAINDSGWVLVLSTNLDSLYLWRNGSIISLNPIPANSQIFFGIGNGVLSLDVNNQNNVVANFIETVEDFGLDEPLGYIWQNGSWSVLQNPVGFDRHVATKINDNNDISGYYFETNEGIVRPLYWQNNAPLTFSFEGFATSLTDDIRLVGGYGGLGGAINAPGFNPGWKWENFILDTIFTSSPAIDINDSGSIIGVAGYLYQDGESYFIESLLDTTANGYSSFQLVAINDFEQIVSVATFGGSVRAILLSQSLLQVTSPQAGETWIAGEQDTIRWISSGIATIEIELSVDNGNTYETLEILYPASAGEYVWSIPDTLLSRKCKIQVTDESLPTLYSESETFKIKGYYLTRVTQSGDYEKFVPNEDGWQFGNNAANIWPPQWWQQFNYSGIDPITNQPYPFQFIGINNFTHPDWPLWVETFGINQCYWNTGLGLYRANSAKRWKAFAEPWGGSCYGFAISSLLGFEFKSEFLAKHPGIPNYTNLYDLSISDNIRKVVNLYYTSQKSKLHLQNRRANKNKKPRTTLAELKQKFLEDDGNIGRLAIYNQLAGGGAHAVTPYGLEKVDGIPGRYIVYAYDSNDPGSDTSWVVIDSTENWWFDILGLEWEGEIGLFLGPPAGDYLSPLILPDISSSAYSSDEGIFLEFFSSYTSNYLMTTVNGDSVGFVEDSIIINIEEAVPLVPEVGRLHPPIGYYVPSDDYFIYMNEFTDSSAYLTVFGDVTYDYQRRDATSNQTDRFYFNGNFSVSSDDADTKIIELSTVIERDSTEKTIYLENTSISKNDSLDMSIQDYDKLTFKNYGIEKSYDLRTIYAIPGSGAFFFHMDISLTANTSHQIVPDWQDLVNTDVTIYVDNGIDGTIDDTLMLKNQITNVEDRGNLYIPKEYKLEQNYPNPFNPSTTIKYSLPKESFVNLKIYNLIGEEVATLVNEEKTIGNYVIEFDATALPSGVYFYRIQAGSFVETKKMILLK
jgi:probable HAF family extracellular repeat protein